jgi:hypothetical protein
MTISLAGSSQFPSSSTNTFDMSTYDVGDLVVVLLSPGSSQTFPNTPTELSGGGVTGWEQAVYNPNDTIFGEEPAMWWGTVSDVVDDAAVTVTWSGTTPGNSAYRILEFTTGGTPTWSVDTTGLGGSESAACTSFPSLSPAAASELYVGYLISTGGQTSSSGTSGYTYVGNGGSQVHCYNPDCGAGSQAPAETVPAFNGWASIAALFKASSAPTQVGPFTGRISHA